MTAAAGSPLDVSVGLPGGWSEDLFGDRSDDGPVMPQPQTEEIRRLARIIPRSVRLGSCSWAFPGWKGIVWSRYSGVQDLANEGLRAYSSHPLLRTVGVDRAYYRPLTVGQYWHFAEQVPDDFRFLVKAPAAVTDCMVRGANGRPLRENAFFLNPEKAAQEFVHPVIEGLGKKAGPLVFEMAQVPRELISSAEKRIRLVERIGEFLNRLPKIGEEAENAFYAVEIRTPIIYTPRFVSMLRSAGARLVTGLHPTMPDVARQTNALHMMDCPEAESPEDFRLAGPLVVRWTRAMGDRFDDAKRRYEPFSKIQRPDPVTREGIATLILAAIRGGQPAYVVANNKAEGCAPLGMVALAERLSERLTEERDRDEQEKLLPTPPKAHP